MTLVLASNSASRKAMLRAAGVAFETQSADVDERALEMGLSGAIAADVALALAMAKAEAVSTARPEALVLGSDSLVEVAGRRFDKPASCEDAAALARAGRTIWCHGDVARLAVRELSDRFIAAYLEAEWPAVAGCVGVFRIEDRGVQLFETIEGSHFTILGMPLMPVLGALRAETELAS